MEKNYKYYVYRIINIESGKDYVGCRRTYKNINEDNYWSSSNYLNEYYKELGKDKFKKEILKTYDTPEAMLDGEVDYIIKFNTMEPNGYNRQFPSKGRKSPFGGKKHKEKTKKQISYSLRSKYNTNGILTKDIKKALRNGEFIPKFGRNNKCNKSEKRTLNRTIAILQGQPYGPKGKNGWPWVDNPDWVTPNWVYTRLEDALKRGVFN